MSGSPPRKEQKLSNPIFKLDAKLLKRLRKNQELRNPGFKLCLTYSKGFREIRKLLNPNFKLDVTDLKLPRQKQELSKPISEVDATDLKLPTKKQELSKPISKLDATDLKLPRKKQKLTKPIFKFDATHLKLHAALRSNNLEEVTNLLKQGIELCSIKAIKNCFILAQENENGEFLKSLLEHNKKGINAIDQNGDSLLINDICKFGCKHFQLLMDLGANVNYKGDENLTALHHAILAEDVNINIIQQLILKNSNVNHLAIGRNRPSDTPITSLIRSINQPDDIFEKTKLLIESGANLNSKFINYDSPLKLAVLTTSELKLIEYLLQHGANPNEMGVALMRCFQPMFYESMDKIKNYIIPVIKLFVDAGYDILKTDADGGSNWQFALRFCTVNKTINEVGYYFLSYVMNLYFSKLNTKEVLSPIEEEAFRCIGKALPIILNHHEQLFNEVTELFSKCSTIPSFRLKYRMYKLTGPYDVLKIKINMSIIGWYIYNVPLKIIISYLMKFDSRHFKNTDDVFTILFLKYIRILHELEPADQKRIIDLVDFLLSNKVSVYSKDDIFHLKSSEYEIPHCLFLSAVYCNEELLNKFLPFWNVHPLAAILSFKPWLAKTSEDRIKRLNRLIKLIPILIKLGGPINKKSDVYASIHRYTIKFNTIAQKQEISTLDRMHSFRRIRISDNEQPLYRRISKLIYEVRGCPETLSKLCRDVICKVGFDKHRMNYVNAVMNSNDIPYGIKDTIAIQPERMPLRYAKKRFCSEPCSEKKGRNPIYLSILQLLSEYNNVNNP